MRPNKNDNNKLDDGEKVVKNVDVTITYEDEDGKTQTAAEVRTDKDGLWKSELCPGEYDVEIDEDDLPDDAKIDKISKIITVKEEKLEDVNFALTSLNEEGRNWLWILLILIAVFLIGLFIYLMSRKREQNQGMKAKV